MRGYHHVTDDERNRAADEIEYAKNWILKSAVTKINQKPKKDLSNHPLMKELDHLKPGEEIAFYYANKVYAKDDQSKIAWMAHTLGWYNVVPNGRRPYTTKIEEVYDEDIGPIDGTTYWKLTVQRLSTSEPLPVSRKKG